MSSLVTAVWFLLLNVCFSFFVLLFSFCGFDGNALFTSLRFFLKHASSWSWVSSCCSPFAQWPWCTHAQTHRCWAPFLCTVRQHLNLQAVRSRCWVLPGRCNCKQVRWDRQNHNASSRALGFDSTLGFSFVCIGYTNVEVVWWRSRMQQADDDTNETEKEREKYLYIWDTNAPMQLNCKHMRIRLQTEIEIQIHPSKCSCQKNAQTKASAHPTLIAKCSTSQNLQPNYRLRACTYSWEHPIHPWPSHE